MPANYGWTAVLLMASASAAAAEVCTGTGGGLVEAISNRDVPSFTGPKFSTQAEGCVVQAPINSLNGIRARDVDITRYGGYMRNDVV